MDNGTNGCGEVVSCSEVHLAKFVPKEESSREGMSLVSYTIYYQSIISPETM